MMLTSLGNSLCVAIGTILLSFGGGAMVALWARTLGPMGRRVIFLSSLATLVLPSFLVTNTWLDLAGPVGKASGVAATPLFSLGGVIWLLSLQYWAVFALALGAVWETLPRSWFELDPALRGVALLRRVLVPVSRDAILWSIVLVFALSVNQMSVPTLLQVPVLAAHIWTRYATDLDVGAAFRAAWPLVIPALLPVLLGRRFPGLGRRDPVPATEPRVWKRHLGPCVLMSVRTFGVALLLISLALPGLQLISSRRTWSELPSALWAGLPAMLTSMQYAAVVATFTLLFSLGVSQYGLFPRVRRPRQSQGKGRGLVTTLWGLLFFLPGMLLAMGAIGLTNALPGKWGYGTSGLAVITLSLHVGLIAWMGARVSLARVDLGIRDALALMPLSRCDSLTRVIWPQIRSAVAATWYLTYLWVLWDVEVMTLLQIPGGETLALRIFNLLHYGHNDQVNALCLQLLCAAALPGVLWWLSASAQRAWTGLAGRGAVAARAGGLALLALSGLLVGCGPSNPSGPTHAVVSIPLPTGLFQRVEVLGERGTAAGQFNKPRSLTVDRQDNLYVVDMTARVQKFSPDGQFLLMWQLAQTDLGKPKGMTCDHQGHIVVVEPHYQRVNHYTTEGQLVRQWGTAGTNVGQLTLPRSVAVNTNGVVWLTEYTLVDRVQSFRLPDATSLGSFGRPGLGHGEFNRAEGIDLDAAGHLFIADSCNHRIQMFSPTGEWLRAYGHAGTAPGQMSYPYDVKVDRQGRQYVCEFGNSRLQIFDAGGRSLEVIGGYGSAPGMFANPWSIALDSHGNLYVADSGNHRVQKLVHR